MELPLIHMSKIFSICLVTCSLFFSVISSFIAAEEDTGTLVVSYQTGLFGERLDRVRFLLIDENHCQQMFPKKEAFVTATSGLARVVMVDHLSPGEYTLEFIIPNADGIFEGVFPKLLKIVKGETVKIDQVITVRYASLKASFKLEGQESTPEIWPKIFLKDHAGKTMGQSQQGILDAPHLLPGEYMLFFSPIKGFITPVPIPMTLGPGERRNNVIGTYLKN